MNHLAGMILAAGYGERLRPATSFTPKPLVSFFGATPFHIALKQLKNCGISDVIVNTHHLPEQILAASESLNDSGTVTLSHEKNLLGTGGAYSQIHQWRKGRDLLVVNGDVVHLFPLMDLIAHFNQTQPLALMGLLPSPHPREASVWCRGTQVLSIGHESPASGAKPHGFACVQILSDRFLTKIREKKPQSVIHYYRKALVAGGSVEGLSRPCYWHDLGTPSRYWTAHKSYLRYMKALSLRASSDPLGVNSVRRQLKRTPLRWIFSPAGPFRGPAAVDSLVSVETGAHAGPWTILSGPVLLRSGVRIENCFIDKMVAHTVDTDRTGVWQTDHFTLYLN